MAINTASGLYRLAQVIKWGGRIFCGLCGVVFLIALGQGRGEADLSLLLYVAAGLLIWGISHALAWILEGFANDS